LRRRVKTCFCAAILKWSECDAHADTTGPEIWSQLMSVGKGPEAFVCGVGTGGTVMGVGRYLRSHDAAIRVHPEEPAESPTLSTGCKAGSHRIQGISDQFIPAIVQLKDLNLHSRWRLDSDGAEAGEHLGAGCRDFVGMQFSRGGARAGKWWLATRWW
jgi:Pyridoxal-phosphate dependent enzyme